MSKYTPLTEHLKARHHAALPMRFSEIESVLGFELPPSSRQHRAWWSNNPSNNVMTKAWLAAGYHTRDVDIAGERLVFEKLNSVDSVSNTSQPAFGPVATEPGSAAPKAPKNSDHPLFGCMAGTVTLDPDSDLTAPLFADDEMDSLLDRKADLIRGGRQ